MGIARLSFHRKSHGRQGLFVASKGFQRPGSPGDGQRFGWKTVQHPAETGQGLFRPILTQQQFTQVDENALVLWCQCLGLFQAPQGLSRNPLFPLAARLRAEPELASQLGGMLAFWRGAPNVSR